jgi:hypothetical protein
MGKVFNHYLVQMGRENSKSRTRYRADGTKESQTKIVLKEEAGERAILFVKFFYDGKSRLYLSQESEILEAADYEIRRSTWKWDAAGRAYDCERETLRFKPRVDQAPPLFDSPDQMLIDLLRGYGVNEPLFEPCAQPVLESDRARASPLNASRQPALTFREPEIKGDGFLTIDSRTLLPYHKK